MRRSIGIAALLACFGLAAEASDGLELSMKSKIAASALAITAPPSAAPFTSAHDPIVGARDPLPELLLREEQDRRTVRGACDYTNRDVCYDLTDGRIVYRPVRQYMPKMDGLTPESVTLHRDRIILRYSFR
jgi:hypothetical protein